MKKYNGKQLTNEQYTDLVKTVTNRICHKQERTRRVIHVGDIVGGIMKRSEGANEREVLSLVYEEVRQYNMGNR